MNIYQQNIQQYQEESIQLAGRLNRLSIIRIAVFVVSLTVITILANERAIGLLAIVVPVCIFGFSYLIKAYNQLAYQKRHASFLKEINEQEIARLENNLSDFPSGQEYINRDHSYAADLDIFGSHSLFQLLNRTTSESGSFYLAEWLLSPVPKEVIKERQEAIQELGPKLEWRQDFQAAGMHFNNAKSEFQKLLAWIEKPAQILPERSKYLIAAIGLGILSTAAVVSYFYYLIQQSSQTGLAILFPSLIINYLALRNIGKLAEDIIDHTHQNVKILKGYESLISKLETEKFDSPLLLQLQSGFQQGTYSASKEITKLSKILEMFQLRGTKRTDNNKFYIIFNSLWLLDIYFIISSEKWKERNRLHLKEWITAISKFEVLTSIAGFHHANPDYTFPEISKKPYHINFEELGHPLIQKKIRVSNDFHLNDRGKIAMITGSNMAGKSTFLRTIGINLVLAFVGAPCCARSGQVSYMKIFTSMRTQDNLEEGYSSFYAELKRIEQLLSLIESGQPIFFLLDEMFKGTNSEDRHKGGVSLIKQLSELNAFGIISTHDLEMAKRAGQYMMVDNFNFSSHIQQGQMLFDYKLTDGICQDFNASELMKRSGIKMLSNFEEIS